MKITLENYGNVHTTTLSEDSSYNDAQEAFDRLLIQAGYSNDIRCADGGHFELEYKEDDD